MRDYILKHLPIVGGLIFLIFLSLVPRSAEVLSGNYIFGFDQGRDFLAVKNIVVDKKITLIGSEIGAGMAGFKGIFHGPFHYYFLAVPFSISGGNPYSGVVLTFLYGIATIVIGYFLGRKLFGVLGAFLVAMLIAVSPPLISFSRFVWNSHGAPVFILLAFYCIYMLAKNKEIEKKYIVGAGFFSAFIYNFQLAISIPMVIALFVYFVLVLRVKNVRQYLLLFLGVCVGFLPMIVFEIRHNFISLRGFIEYVSNSGKTEATIKPIELLLKDHLGAFAFNFYDIFPRQDILSGELIGLFIGALTIYFLLREKRQDLKNFILYLLILPFITFLVFSPLRNAVYQYYLVSLVLAYILLFSYICFAAFREKKLVPQVILVLFLAFLLIQHVPNAVSTFKNDYVDYGGDAKIKGKLNALDYIYNDAKGEPFCLLTFTPPVYTYAYDYVVWWYGNKKYHYIPCEEKKGTFYLWIEVDPSKPWSYEGWLETVIKTGTVLETKRLPSGFIIQKRLADEAI